MRLSTLLLGLAALTGALSTLWLTFKLKKQRAALYQYAPIGADPAPEDRIALTASRPDYDRADDPALISPQASVHSAGNDTAILHGAPQGQGHLHSPVPDAAQPASGDPLDNKPWISLVEDCVELVDELDRVIDSLDPPRQEMVEHAIDRLREILERSSVDVITEEASFDRNRHKPVNPAPGLSSGAPIAQTLSPGFAVGRRVLRRARVKLADDM